MRLTLGRYEAMGPGAWYASGSEAGRLSLAGMWLALVSLPLFQFLLLRWYFRLLIWARMLWRLSRLDLGLIAIHPDKAGGLGFLSESLIAFAPLAAAHGVLVAGMLADRILYGSARLTQFKTEVFGGAAVLVVLFAGPLMLFAPVLARAKRDGLRAYGALGQSYVRAFRDRWITGAAPAGEPLLGTGDIQSLADLGNSYGLAQQMNVTPARARDLMLFAGAYFAPILPLVLTLIPLEQLLGRLLKVVL